MKTYKKIFDLKLNDKTYTIFVDEKGRFTFLGKNSDGKYTYLDINDFLMLHNAYNNRNPFINNLVHNYRFEEKVRAGVAALLSVVVWTTSLSFFNRKYDTKTTEQELVITENEVPTYAYIKNRADLDNALGYSEITVEQVHDAINKNDQLPDDYKFICHMLVNELTSKYPNVDLRIFYENVMDLYVNNITQEELQKYYGGNITANFVINRRMINAPADANTEVIVHELCHSFVGIMKEVNGHMAVKICEEGNSLHEAMNNRMANLIIPTRSYIKEGAILDYFCTCVDYDIPDYISNGISDLINKMVEKYPDVDIHYIVKTLDAINSSFTNFLVDVDFDENIDFLDELFEICKINATNYENPYRAFTEFAKLLRYASNQELFYSYLDKYNEYLKTQGIDDIITSESVREKYIGLKEVNGIAWMDGKFYPVIFDSDNELGITMTSIIIDGEYHSSLEFHVEKISDLNNAIYLLYSLPENYDDTNSSAYWRRMAIESGAMQEKHIEPVSINLKGEELTKALLINLNVQIGVNENDEVAFSLLDESENIIYTSSPNMKNKTRLIPLLRFMTPLPFGDEVELSNYFNEEYLKIFLKEKVFNLQNVYLEDEKIVVEPIYNLDLKDENKVETYEVLDIWKLVNKSPGTIGIRGLPVEFESDVIVEDTIILKDILKYYGLLNPDNPKLEMTVEELKEIVARYVDEVLETKSR